MIPPGVVPPIGALLSLRLDPWALGLAAVALIAYLAGVRRVRARGGAWPSRRTVGFVAGGLGAYLLVSLGFLGVYSADSRWVFVTRVALLVVAVPALVVLGRPLSLLEAATSSARVHALRGSRLVRALGSPVVAPLVPLAVFALLITPVAGWLRTTAGGGGAVDVAVPLLGLAVAAPLAEPLVEASSLRITGEFTVAFVELVADALPGILMRLAATVLDGVVHRAAGAPLWVPSPLRDQQLAGDLLWCLAEAADLPALILLLRRWVRTDRKEAKRIDDLSDEDYDALTRAHLGDRRP
ncbi:cytochrome c oxidase assembly protein [Amnibacterium endophyticum]|uniref:Cytochrome c oxidase assembly protein n=1 Tax=Amnibacterium endophyticum TaxID=2109337 RepID=A0ABW4LGJ5_9MICO